MILDIILGSNIDTNLWVEELLEKNADHIVILDYEYLGEPILKQGILHMSAKDTEKYSRQFDTLNYYKSLYAYPGMSGKMRSLYKE